MQDDLQQEYKIEFNQNIRESIQEYYTLMDVVTELGGLNAAATAIIASYAFWFSIQFFWDLAEIIKKKRNYDLKLIEINF